MPTQGIWLECNGQSTTAYPALAAIVGANVPDYRGIFLRGYGSQTSTHYNTVIHSSGTLGALQGDSIRNITGQVEIGDSYLLYPTGVFSSSKSQANPSIGSGRTGNVRLSLDISTQVPTANENRPVNKAVRYLIKAA